MFGFILGYPHPLSQIEILDCLGILDKLVENDGHQVEEEHCFPSRDWWTNIGF
jgi:hypothetical protein